MYLRARVHAFVFELKGGYIHIIEREKEKHLVREESDGKKDHF